MLHDASLVNMNALMCCISDFADIISKVVVLVVNAMLKYDYNSHT